MPCNDGGSNTAGPWIDLVLLNGWTALTSYTFSPAYRKLTNGNVQLRGGIKSGTTANGTPIANMPAGYIPNGRSVHLVFSVSVSVLLVAETDGSLKIYNAPGAINNAELSLSGVQYATI